jgi:hypothetical protein
MNKGKDLASLLIMVSISLIGCASAPSGESVRQEKNIESLSASAYKRVLPRLVALKPGDNIDSQVEWRFFKTTKQGRTIDTYAVADGWVAPLSGGNLGALGLGRVRGRSGDMLFGEHVFGYLWGGVTLVPQYAVVTQATLILPNEYDDLMKKQSPQLGWADMPRDNLSPKTQFKNATVKEVRRLNFSEPDLLEVGVEVEEEKVTLADTIRRITARERFEAAVTRLESLEPGTEFWEAIRALDMIYLTPDSGIKYHIIGDGFLGGSWTKLMPNGFFAVMRFGYIEDNKEVPKLALIFKNNKVHKLVPHASREALQRYFKE